MPPQVLETKSTADMDSLNNKNGHAREEGDESSPGTPRSHSPAPRPQRSDEAGATTVTMSPLNPNAMASPDPAQTTSTDNRASLNLDSPRFFGKLNQVSSI